MSSRASSRNSGRGVNGAVGGDAGDMPTTRKLSSRAEFAKGNNASFSSSLEVLEHGDTDETQSRSSSRISLGSRSRSNLGSVPPRSDSSLSQRIPTPTKHVSLTAVRRKQEVDAPIEPELDWREFTRSNSRLGLGGRSYTNTFRLTETAEDETHDESEENHKAEAQASAVPSDPAGEVTTQMQAMDLNSGGQSQVKENKQSSDDDDDDDDDDDSDSEEEPRKAPNELLMEFLDSVMKKEYKTAEKLCRMILIYEPTNQEALTFHPVILEKLQLEQEAAERGEDGSGEDDDNDDDDDSDEDDDDEDDDSEEDSSLDNDSSDEDEEEQEENNADNFPEEAEPSRPDSGIGM